MIMVYVAYGYMAVMALVLLYYGTDLSYVLKGVVYRRRNNIVNVRFAWLPTMDTSSCWFKYPDVWARMRNDIFEGHDRVPPETVMVYFKNEKTKAMWLLRNK